MKRLLALITLATVVILAGCGWMDGEYVSITPHQVGYDPDAGDSAVISSYSQLRSAITGLIDTGSTEAVFTLTDYPEENILRDMESVTGYALNQYPTGAWAASDIRWAYGQNLLSVQIDYRRSKADIDRIRTVRGIDGAKEAINEALSDCADSLVLQISGYSETDFIQYAADFAALNPNVVMELPQITAQVVPQQGTVRILELQFSYQNSRDSLRYMLSQVKPVFSSARLYVSGDTDDAVKLSQLYGFLMERFDYTFQTSITPTYSLLCYGIGDSRAFAQVYAAMCRQAGLEAMTVSGTFRGESRFWNIVRQGEAFYHVDLLECARQGSFRLRADGEMNDYVWDYSAYPVCGEVPDEPTVSTELPPDAREIIP